MTDNVKKCILMALLFLNKLHKKDMFEKEIKLSSSILETLRSQTNGNETTLVELK